MATNKFEHLFVDENELTEEILNKTLTKERVVLTKKGEIIFQKDFKPKVKILFYLLANKIFVINEIKKEEYEGPKQIQEKIGVPIGTVKPSLRNLLKSNFLSSESGKYFVPNYALKKVEEYINKEK